ncbi:phosphopantothenoylcysteine decarboxylase, partial [Levilactobacillus parabrevis]|nr:phosphopantothenoylcysteine decarboxylase [Levilactobacillus parabrevis]
LESKSLDLLAANDVSRADIGFNSDDNQVTFIQADGVSDQTPKTSKTRIAAALVAKLATILATK